MRRYDLCMGCPDSMIESPDGDWYSADDVDEEIATLRATNGEVPALLSELDEARDLLWECLPLILMEPLRSRIRVLLEEG